MKYESEKFSNSIQKIAGLVKAEISWIEDTELRRIAFVNDEIKEAYVRELATADQLVSMLYTSIDECESISDYWFVSHDAIVVDSSKRIISKPSDPPVPRINHLFKDRLNEEQLSLIEKHLRSLCTDRGILEEDLHIYLNSFENGVRSITTCNENKTMRLATLPGKWLSNGFPQNLISSMHPANGYIDFESLLISLAQYRGESVTSAD